MYDLCLLIFLPISILSLFHLREAKLRWAQRYFYLVATSLLQYFIL